MRIWFDFAGSKKDAKPQHTALYAWIVELNNRLGWIEEFGLPSYDSMEVLGFGNKNTYLKALRDLSSWGFVEIVQPAKNQFQACIIKICRVKNELALGTALTQHKIQHCSSIDTSTDPINKHIKPNKLINNKTVNENRFSKIDFRNALIFQGAEEQHVDDWIKVREAKRASFTKTALDSFINECEKNNYPVSDAVRICAEKSWQGFKYEWTQVKEPIKHFQRKLSNATNQITSLKEYSL